MGKSYDSIIIQLTDLLTEAFKIFVEFKLQISLSLRNLKKWIGITVQMKCFNVIRSTNE